MAGIMGTAAGLGSNMATMTAGASATRWVGNVGMGLEAAQNMDSLKQTMEQGMYTSMRNFGETIAKTAKSGSEAIKGLV